MFDPAYLATLDQQALEELQQDCSVQSDRRRHEGNWGLSWWWWQRSLEIGRALEQLHLARAQPSFVRGQLTIESMPTRIAPHER